MRTQSYQWLVDTADNTSPGGAYAKLTLEAIHELRRRQDNGHKICWSCNGKGWVGFRDDNIPDELCLECGGIGSMKRDG